MPGKLIAIGGAENKTSASAILRRIIDYAPADNREVAVVTTASGIPDEVFVGYQDAFQQIGATGVHHVDVRLRENARADHHIELVGRCGIVFISGGDQLRLTNVLGASPLLAAIRQARAEGTVVAGTSAGAAAMSATMIYNGAAADALRKGAVRMSAGLALVDGIVIDSHFLERGRFTRLMEVGATNPEYIGIGLGEDAAAIVHNDHILEAIGSGHVIVVDSTDLYYSDVAELSDGVPVAVSHVIMHALTSGHGFDLVARQFLREEELKATLGEISLENSGAPGASRAELF